MKKYEEAINDYDKAIKLEPNNSYFYYKKGLAYEKIGKYEEAVNNYNKAIKLEPDDVSFYCTRGKKWRNMKRH